MTFDAEEFSRINGLRSKHDLRHKDNPWTASDWAMAVTGEFGELCNMLKKRRRGEDISQEAIAKEFGDTLAYLDLLAQCVGIDLWAATISKFNEVSDRIGSDYKL